MSKKLCNVLDTNYVVLLLPSRSMTDIVATVLSMKELHRVSNFSVDSCEFEHKIVSLRTIRGNITSMVAFCFDFSGNLSLPFTMFLIFHCVRQTVCFSELSKV
jgi:hypothetical protein